MAGQIYQTYETNPATVGYFTDSDEIPAGAAYASGVAKIGEYPSIVKNCYLGAENTPTENTRIIQAALDQTGTVELVGDGVIYINNTLIIRSNTHLKLSKNLVIRLAPNTNKCMLMNEKWGATAKQVTAISVSNPVIAGTAAVLVTATVATHAKSPGDYVFIHGVVPDIYNGVWKVHSVPDANNLTYILAYDVGDSIAAGAGTQVPVIPTTGAYTPALAPAGMYMRDADVNITIEGGEWDYDGYRQTTPESYLKHAIYIRKVGNVCVKNLTMKNVTKYAIAIGNAYNGLCENIELDTISDGVHWIGSGDNLVARNIKGKSGDDFVVAGQSDYWFYLDPEYVFGDFGTVYSENLKPRQSFSVCKYYGMSTNTIRNFACHDVGGLISGSVGHILIYNDTTGVGSESGGATARTVNISASIDQGYSKASLDIGGGITVNELVVPNLTCALGNTAGTSNGIFVHGGAIVNNLIAGNLRFFAGSGAYQNNSYGIYVDGTSKITKAQIATISCKNIVSGLRLNNPNAVDDGIIYNVGTYNTDGCAGALIATGRITLNIGLAIRDGYNSSNVQFSFSDFSRLSVGRARGLDGNSVCSVAAGKNLMINAPDVGIDTSILAGTLAGQRNSSYFNVGAAIGTLQQYNTVYYRPADAKWVQVTNTTLTS